MLSLMTAALAVASIGVAAAPAGAAVAAAPARAAETCPTVRVSYNGLERGWLSGCFEAGRDGVGYYVVSDFQVKDVLDEPTENNVVYASIMVAYRNAAGTYYYQEYGPFAAPGDGPQHGVKPFAPLFEASGGRHTSYWADYIRITVTAPGKASQVSRFDV
jgi:hypothetical protein